MQHRGRQIGADANLAAWQHGQPVDPGPQPRPAVLSIPDPALTRRGRLDEALRVAIGEGEADRAARMDLGHAGAVDMDLAGRRLGADPDPPGGGHHQLVGAGPQPGRAALGIPDPALARGRDSRRSSACCGRRRKPPRAPPSESCVARSLDVDHALRRVRADRDHAAEVRRIPASCRRRAACRRPAGCCRRPGCPARPAGRGRPAASRRWAGRAAPAADRHRRPARRGTRSGRPRSARRPGGADGPRPRPGPRTAAGPRRSGCRSRAKRRAQTWSTWLSASRRALAQAAPQAQHAARRIQALGDGADVAAGEARSLGEVVERHQPTLRLVPSHETQRHEPACLGPRGCSACSGTEPSQNGPSGSSTRRISRASGAARRRTERRFRARRAAARR